MRKIIILIISAFLCIPAYADAVMDDLNSQMQPISEPAGSKSMLDFVDPVKLGFSIAEWAACGGVFCKLVFKALSPTKMGNAELRPEDRASGSVGGGMPSSQRDMGLQQK